ncbi:TPA: TonB-dependent siderophore receptor [Stenotrophomonas maltophilia]|uniref:TonB-dependent receptor n=1 Tax=Stenotrophomonas sp. TaxID=69392 RepID=UPI0028B00B0A|nr:TonB-dependent siderophore receptor [Stenotrophomonas sp.]HDS1037693.1 TonB-dependent siderophore receptor [Stenotrophomonas maltophilia]HDS1041907.1 TonB-dependent siderophore receptor [Stenotrophomonas maltophilia]
MNRCLRPTLLALALCAALPLHASEAEASPDVAADGAERSPTELAAVRVQAGRPATDTSRANAFGGGSWKETPASVNVLGRDYLDRRQVRSLSELASNDASLGDAYAPVGYYQNIAIRGFALDAATGYRFNGLAIAGEQRLALENVQEVQILKGEAGLAAGVMAPGGIINYVGKRPAEVRNVTLGTDSEGSRYVAADVGHWITPRFGVRLNAAWDASDSYVEHAEGRRNFYSLAADWLIGERGKLEVDANYQTSSQRSVSGYQLLGARELPRGVDRKHLLGYQPWQRPVDIASTNITALHTYDFNERWQSRVSVGYSRSVIDDNVAFAYGCYYTAQCADGSTPGNYFAPNGDYDIYDYRSPDDTRRNQQARAELRGRFDTGSIGHELTVGADYFRRTVDRRPSVNEYVGSANIHDAQVPLYEPSPLQAGPSARRLDSRQTAVFALDRIRFNDDWQWLAGGRFVRLDERAYDKRGAPQRQSRLSRFLPQTALVWKANDQLNVYGSYVRGISLGQEAPFWTANADEFLPAVQSRQLEVGVKYAPVQALTVGAALFRISQPYQYAQPDDSEAGYTFVQQGTQTHTGLELTANGQLTDALQIVASASVLQARARDAGTPAYEGHQLVNVPKVRASVHLAYALPFVQGLDVTGGWRYASSNVARADGSVRAPDYSVFDAGLRFQHRLHERAVTWNLSVDNVFNRFYWRDTGSSGGDYYLFPGAPRQARLSVTFAL